MLQTSKRGSRVAHSRRRSASAAASAAAARKEADEFASYEEKADTDFQYDSSRKYMKTRCLRNERTLVPRR